MINIDGFIPLDAYSVEKIQKITFVQIVESSLWQYDLWIQSRIVWVVEK